MERSTAGRKKELNASKKASVRLGAAVRESITYASSVSSYHMLAIQVVGGFGANEELR